MENRILFRLYRESLGMSQQAVSDYLNINIRTVKSWESGRENLPEPRLEQIENLYAEFKSSCKAMEQRIVAQVQEHQADSVPLLVYMSRPDYQSVSWIGETWPTSEMHRQQIFGIYQALLTQTKAMPVLVPFQKEVYFEWLAGRNDDTGMRAQWAAEQVKE